MDFSYNDTYKLDSDFEILVRDDEYLYVNYEHANWIRINSMGHELVQNCDGNATLEDIIGIMSKKYKFSLETLKLTFSDFIKTVIERRLLIKSSNDREESPINCKGKKTPSEIWIHVTGKCNLKCPFCYSASGDSVKNELDYEEIIKFLKQIPEEKRKSITISGGEPFLYSRLGDLLKELKEMNFLNVTVITNGTVGTEKYKELLPSIDQLQFSIDGTTAEIHERTRGTGSFEKTIKNISLAKEIGVKRLIISFTATNRNIENLSDIPKLAFDIGANSIHITRLMPVGRGQDSYYEYFVDDLVFKNRFTTFVEKLNEINNYIYKIRNVDEIFLEEEKKRSFIGVTVAGDQYLKIAHGHKNYNCGLGSSIISIGYDGNIYPCASLHKNEFILGKLENADFQQVCDNGNIISEKLNVDNCNMACSKCKIKYLCGGGCRACALAHGDIMGKDSKCEFYNEGIVESMWNYKNILAGRL